VRHKDREEAGRSQSQKERASQQPEGKGGREHRARLQIGGGGAHTSLQTIAGCVGRRLRGSAVDRVSGARRVP
jgi:hypothetical protein